MEQGNTISSCRCCCSCHCIHGHFFPLAISFGLSPLRSALVHFTPLHFYLFSPTFVFLFAFFLNTFLFCAAVGRPNTRSPFRNLCTHKLKALEGTESRNERKKSVLVLAEKPLAAFLELQFRCKKNSGQKNTNDMPLSDTCQEVLYSRWVESFLVKRTDSPKPSTKRLDCWFWSGEKARDKLN